MPSTQDHHARRGQSPTWDRPTPGTTPTDGQSGDRQARDRRAPSDRVSAPADRRAPADPRRTGATGAGAQATGPADERRRDARPRPFDGSRRDARPWRDDVRRSDNSRHDGRPSTGTEPSATSRDSRPARSGGYRDDVRPGPVAHRAHADRVAVAPARPSQPRGQMSPMPDQRPGRAQAPASVLRTLDAASAANIDAFAALPLRAEVRAAIDAMGITVPTPIQAQAIPSMLRGEDVVGQARTGSGKTLAFAVPTVENCDPAARAVQALILVPTRELAIQVGEVVEKLARARRLRLTLLYGGRSLLPESRALASGAQIIVGTPGRTLDHLRQGNLKLGQLRLFILDEGDEMLDRGFAPDVERILGFAPKNRQTALFSATIAEWVLDTASRHMRSPVLVKVDHSESPPEIEHVVYEVEPAVRHQALRTLLDRRGSDPILVFGRTKHGVKKLARQLEAEGYPVGALHGNLSQNARERAMVELRSGTLPILVATNVAARGLDIDSVAQVINYEVPESAALFTHRVGRTGRMGKSGEAITFVTPDDAVKWRQIERVIGKRLPRRAWEGGEPSDASPINEASPVPLAAAPRDHSDRPHPAGAGARIAADAAPVRRPRRRFSGPYGQRPAR